MRIIVISAALLGCASAGAIAQEHAARPPMFGPNAKQPPTTREDVEREYAAAVACSSRVAALQARTSTTPASDIAAGAWRDCKGFWDNASLTFGAYSDPIALKPRSLDEAVNDIGTAHDGLWRRWRVESDRIVARVRGEGPRL